MRTISRLKLYGDKESQPVRAVMALLAMGHVDYEFVPVDLATFQTRSKEFLKLNPLAHIPLLVDGGFKLAESNAILLYLCEKYTQIPRALSGRNIEERALVNQYLSWYQNEFRPAFFEPIMMRKRFLLTGQTGMFTPANEQFAWLRIEQTAKLLDRIFRLSDKSFLCGDHVTVADLLVYFEWTNLWLYQRDYDVKHVKQWAARMEAIPEVAAINKEFLATLDDKRRMLMSVKPPAPKL